MAYGHALECELQKLGIEASIRGNKWNLVYAGDGISAPWHFHADTGKLFKPYQSKPLDTIRASPQRVAYIISEYMKPPAWVEKPHAAIKKARDASGS